MIKRFLSIFIIAISAIAASAQDIVFNTTEYDFGSVNAEEGSLYYVFRLKNVSKEQIRIGTLYPSCSCLYVNMDNKVIEPGEEGEIGVTMALSGYAGRMFRTVDVYTIDDKHLATLNLFADIIPPQRDLEYYYPIILSEELLCNRDNMNFGYLYWDNTTQLSLGIVNVSKQSIKLSAKTEGIGKPILEYPEVLEPGQKADIVVKYFGKRGDYLACNDELKISINGKQAVKAVKLKCIIMESLEKTENSPALWSNPSFAPFKAKRKVYNGSLELGNSGVSDLVIYAVFSNAKSNIEPGMSIAPGKSIKVKASSKEPKAKIELFTNDPVRPYKELIFSN